MKMYNANTQEDNRIPLKISVPKPRPKQALPADVTTDVLVVVDNFPSVADKIFLMWGYVELQKYLGSLLVEEKDGRPRFPPLIAAALMHIYEAHSKLFPDRNNDSNVWNSVSY